MQPHTGTVSGTNLDRDGISPVQHEGYSQDEDPEPPGGSTKGCDPVEYPEAHSPLSIIQIIDGVGCGSVGEPSAQSKTSVKVKVKTGSKLNSQTYSRPDSKTNSKTDQYSENNTRNDSEADPGANSDFPISLRALSFLTKYYPSATVDDWNDWHWQVRNRIRTVEQLERVIEITEDERRSVEMRTANLPIAITPHYLSLLSPTDSEQPLRKTHIPVGTEFVRTPGEDPDPLSEEHDKAAPGLIHRYPDRVLFLTTGFCSTYCRYCTRSRMVGETNGQYSFSKDDWEKAAQYIEAHPEIRDCLLSGGDPLSIGDGKLEWLLNRLRSIKHLEFIRIGTKIPVVMPQRITRELCDVLKKFHPLWMSIHFTHPEELTDETIEACTRLADAGIPLGSQTVLLKGINDDALLLKKLFHGLLKVRVKPYYLYQCDPVSGSSHFRTPVEKGLEIIRQLRGHTTGYAIPQLVIDAPGGGGKIPVAPDYILGRDGDDLLLTNFEGGVFRYPDPGGRSGLAQNFLRTQGADYVSDSGIYLP